MRYKVTTSERKPYYAACLSDALDRAETWSGRGHTAALWCSEAHAEWALIALRIGVKRLAVGMA